MTRSFVTLDFVTFPKLVGMLREIEAFKRLLEANNHVLDEIVPEAVGT
jgi:hypothetical protein